MCLITCFFTTSFIQNLFQKLNSEIWDFQWQNLSVIPVFTALILLILFQIIRIRQSCGFTFTTFFCFLTASNALTTSWVTFSNTSVFCFSYFLIWFSHGGLVKISSTHAYFRNRTILLCLDDEKQKDKSTFKDNSQSEYFIY